MIFSLTKSDEYYFKYIDSKKYNIAYNYKKNSLLIKMFARLNNLIIKICGRSPKRLNNFVCKLKYDNVLIDNIKKNNKVVCLESYLKRDFFQFVHDCNNKNFYLLIWNSIIGGYVDYFYGKYLDTNHIFSYSKADSIKYGLTYFNDFHLFNLKNYFQSNEIQYDFYFLGRDKNRVSLLSKFSSIVSKMGYFTNIEIFTTIRNKKADYINYIYSKKTFDDYLTCITKTRCLIDFCCGENISFRTIEAMIFKKKLITTNLKIKEYDFYNENNIFIFDDNINYKNLDEFLKKPYIPIDYEITKKYDFDYIYCYFERMKEIK